MFRKTLCVAIAMISLCLVPEFAAEAQQKPADQQKAMEMQKQQEEYMKLMAPGPHHAFLKSYVGDWTLSLTATMMPGAASEKSEGSLRAEMILGDRFVRMQYKGTMAGQPYEGLEIIGYDTLEKMYRTFWIDNAGTSFYTMSGELDKTGKELRESGKWPNMPGKPLMPVRAVTRFMGPDEFVFELYMVADDGKEFKSLEYTAVRKK